MDHSQHRLSSSDTPHESTAQSSFDLEFPEVDLLSPIKIRGLHFRNRIVMSPMCQYSAQNGMADDWHLVHLGNRAVGGTPLVFVEATAVTEEGRITPGDTGIWSDQHVDPLARIVRFLKRQGSVPGIQLAHAGRKASCEVPWKGGKSLSLEEGGWPVVGPSPIPFSLEHQVPHSLSETEIDEIVDSFGKAALRALNAGFEVIEIHSAHGYLLHSFLSPLSNDRNDSYGGSFNNRIRLLMRIATALRDLIPEKLALFVRISATDWAEGGWDIEQSVRLAQELRRVGVDLIDVSSGGLIPKASIPLAKGYQVPFARRIRKEAHIRTGAVGLITDVDYASEIIANGDADMVFIGRELLRHPYFALEAEGKMGVEPRWPVQYGYAVKRHSR